MVISWERLTRMQVRDFFKSDNFEVFDATLQTASVGFDVSSVGANTKILIKVPNTNVDLTTLSNNLTFVSTDSTLTGLGTSGSPLAVVQDYVTLTGNQTVAGTKLFSSTISGSINGNAATVTDGVYTTGNQTIGGIKTFSSFPVTPSSAPTTNYEVANKKYVDDNAGGGGSSFALELSIIADQTIATSVTSIGPITVADDQVVTINDDIVWSIEDSPSGGGVTHGRGAPTHTPPKVGAGYVDDTTGSIYTAIATNGSYNWGYVGKGSLSSFNKNTVSGLLFWYDASDSSYIVKDGGNSVSNIYDKSDSGYHLAPMTAAQKPLWVDAVQNGLPALYFNPTGATATGMTRGNLSVASQPITIFVVVKPIRLTYGSNQQIFEGHASGRQLIEIQATSNKYTLYAGGSAVSNAVASSETVLLTCIFNGASSSIQVNNLSAQTGLNPSTGGLYGPTFGADYNNNYSYSGYWMASLGYSGALSNENQDTIRAYLNNRFAIY